MTLWGQGRIEVIAAQSKIKQDLEQGIPIKRIYDELAQNRKVTVTYNSFRRQVRSYCMMENVMLVSALPMKAGQERGQEKPFQFDPTVKLERFF